jgi:hypothetical protein
MFLTEIKMSKVGKYIFWGRMVVGLMQSVPITATVVSSKPAQARCTRYNIIIKGKYVDKVYAVWICLLHHNITSEKKSSLGLGYGV